MAGVRVTTLNPYMRGVAATTATPWLSFRPALGNVLRSHQCHRNNNMGTYKTYESPTSRYVLLVVYQMLGDLLDRKEKTT